MIAVILERYGSTPFSRTTKARMDRAIKLAALSDMKQRHGAVLVSGGRIVSLGINVLRNEPRYWMPLGAISTHAEIQCVSGLASPVGTLYVARLSPGGNLSNSLPCESCMRYLKVYTNIRKVVYT